MEQVFISYSSVDRREAFELRQILAEAGADVWLDFFDIKPASVLQEQLSSNLDAASVVCVLLSPTSVASSWVRYEMRYARDRGAALKVVPVILRPCPIPEEMAELVGIDASGGLSQEAVRLRLVRGILGDELASEGELLTAAQSALWADRQLEADAARDAPREVARLDRVRAMPIRSVRLDVDHRTFPDPAGLVVELRLRLNPLWSRPMSFFVARYREGRTWPPDTGFTEPAHDEFALDRRPRLDGKFTWFDRVEDLSLALDGSSLHRTRASFSLALDGGAFQPSTGQPSLPHAWEIPSLQKLVDDGCSFTLLAHLGDTTEEWDDPESSPVDLELSASFRDEQPDWVTLFSSRHEPKQRVLLASPALTAFTNPIEREALAGLLRPPRPARTQQDYQPLLDAAVAGRPVPEEDVPTVAGMAVDQSQLMLFRRDDRRGLELAWAAARLLEPVVHEGYPSYEEAVAYVRAVRDVVTVFRRNGREAGELVPYASQLVAVAQRLAGLDPDNAEYRRIEATSLATLAQLLLQAGDRDQGVGALVAGVEIWGALAHELPSPQRAADARRAYADALTVASRLEVGEDLPLQRWRELFDPGNRIQDAIRDQEEERRLGPGWMRPTGEPAAWPTSRRSSPALRYALPVPSAWPPAPAVQATGSELAHVYAGTDPGTLLSVHFMDRAVPGHDMTNWVTALVSMTGFPLLELVSGDGRPELADWRYLGAFPACAHRFGADEAMCWSGVARLPGDQARWRRLYVTALRKQTFAWKVALVIDTVLPPGSDPALVRTADDARARTVFANLETAGPSEQLPEG